MNDRQTDSLRSCNDSIFAPDKNTHAKFEVGFDSISYISNSILWMMNVLREIISPDNVKKCSFSTLLFFEIGANLPKDQLHS